MGRRPLLVFTLLPGPVQRCGHHVPHTFCDFNGCVHSRESSHARAATTLLKFFHFKFLLVEESCGRRKCLVWRHDPLHHRLSIKVAKLPHLQHVGMYLVSLSGMSHTLSHFNFFCSSTRHFTYFPAYIHWLQCFLIASISRSVRKHHRHSSTTNSLGRTLLFSYTFSSS